MERLITLAIMFLSPVVISNHRKSYRFITECEINPQKAAAMREGSSFMFHVFVSCFSFFVVDVTGWSVSITFLFFFFHQSSALICTGTLYMQYNIDIHHIHSTPFVIHLYFPPFIIHLYSSPNH